MKKTYFVPCTRTVNIELHSLMAGSTPAEQLNTGGGIYLGDSEEGGGDDVDLGSRRRSSVWDD